jgi:hypothetical protein
MIDKISEIPVLVLGYSRTESIEQIVMKLREFGVNRIFLSLDFAEDSNVRKKQVALISKLREQIPNESNLQIWHRTRNHGVAAGIISGLDWFFSHCARGVIIEDDLKFNRDFLEFCAVELGANQFNKDVLLISGNRFNTRSNNHLATLSNYPQIWGWASWSEKWLEMRKLILMPKRFKLSNHLLPKFAFFFAGARRVQLGYLDTWDLPLAYEMIHKKKYCLLPPVNLVSNLGFDAHAVHTRKAEFPLDFPLATLPSNYQSEFRELMNGVDTINHYLEKKIFKIKFRHILSPLKLSLAVSPVLERSNKMQPLEVRVRDSERYE